MTDFLLLPETHLLHPFANRLLREGHRALVVPRRDRFERAWSGRLVPALSGKAKSHTDSWRALLADLDAPVILTDSPKWEEWVRGVGKRTYSTGREAPPIPGLQGEVSGVALGAWVMGGQPSARHVYVEDAGAWPGGLGPFGPGGGTILAAEWDEEIDRLLPLHRDGLVQVRVQCVPTTLKAERPEDLEFALRVVETRWGWWPVWAQAWLAALGDETALGDVLQGTRAPELGSTFTVAIPVSVPPWPIECNVPAREAQVRVEKPTEIGDLVWHDVAVRGTELWTAGLDGLVGVAHGGGETLAEAQRAVLGVVGDVQVPEVQYRPDVGQGVGVAVVVLSRVGVRVRGMAEAVGAGREAAPDTLPDTPASPDADRLPEDTVAASGTASRSSDHSDHSEESRRTCGLAQGDGMDSGSSPPASSPPSELAQP